MEIDNEIAIEILKTFRQAMDTPITNYRGLLLGSLDKAIKALENERPQALWIPIEYRPMSEFEYNEFLSVYGYLEPEERKMFCCQMPEDQQEILISTKWGVCLDKCEIDFDDNDNPVYGLEEHEDWDGVMAWMPLPEQYKGGAE